MATLYEQIHNEFIRIREIANAMNNLDPSINEPARSKVWRLTYLDSLPEHVVKGIQCGVCALGEKCNSEEDPLYICPDNPMLGLIRDFMERYIDNPFPQEKFDLSIIQTKIILLGLSSPNLGILAPRGVGKSVALALIAIMWCFFCAKGEDVFIVAPTTNQTEKVYSYVEAFIESSKYKMLLNGDPSIGYEGVDQIRWGQKPQVTWRQGTSMRPACASHTNHGNTMRGQQPTFEIIDESSYIGDDIYYRTLKAGMGSKRSDHDNIIVESGTPDSKNHFYDLFYDKQKFGHYQKVKFDFQDGLKCGRYTQASIDKIMAEAGGFDSEEFKSEYRSMFPDSSTNFFKNLEHAFSGTVVETYPLPGMTYIAGLDLGRINDSTVLTVGRYEITPTGDRIDIIHIKEIHPAEDQTYPQQYEIIVNELAKWRIQTCYVDFTGPGIPIFESLRQIVMQRGLGTTLVEFTFQGNNKYPQFLRLKALMQVDPLPRVRYPNNNYEMNKAHPDYQMFVKAEQEFRDIIQKRSNSASETSKYRVEPAKQRGHDDYVASCICLIQGISDSFNDKLLITNTNTAHSKNEREIYRKQTGMGVRVGGKPKGLNTWKKYNIWRQL